MNCGACKYWQTEGHYGACKRFPNVVAKPASDWCGEYANRETIALPVVEMTEPKKRGRPSKETT